jgi:hypothetical protein
MCSARVWHSSCARNWTSAAPWRVPTWMGRRATACKKSRSVRTDHPSHTSSRCDRSAVQAAASRFRQTSEDPICLTRLTQSPRCGAKDMAKTPLRSNSNPRVREPTARPEWEVDRTVVVLVARLWISDSTRGRAPGEGRPLPPDRTWDFIAVPLAHRAEQRVRCRVPRAGE